MSTFGVNLGPRIDDHEDFGLFKGSEFRVQDCGFIDYKTSMITDEDPLRGLLLY